MPACVCAAETGRKKKGDKARERMGGRKREGTTQWDKNNLGWNSMRLLNRSELHITSLPTQKKYPRTSMNTLRRRRVAHRPHKHLSPGLEEKKKTPNNLAILSEVSSRNLNETLFSRLKSGLSASFGAPPADGSLRVSNIMSCLTWRKNQTSWTRRSRWMNTALRAAGRGGSPECAASRTPDARRSGGGRAECVRIEKQAKGVGEGEKKKKHNGECIWGGEVGVWEKLWGGGTRLYEERSGSEGPSGKSLKRIWCDLWRPLRWRTNKWGLLVAYQQMCTCTRPHLRCLHTRVHTYMYSVYIYT